MALLPPDSNGPSIASCPSSSYICFRDWKLQDEAKLLARIKNALLTLYGAEQHLPPDDPEGSKRKIQLRQKIEKL